MAVDYLSTGNVKDMTEYTRVTAKIAAFRAVLEEILEIERRYTDD